MSIFKHSTTKADLALYLRGFAIKHDSAAVAAIEALGELGGIEAVEQLGTLFENEKSGFQNSTKGIAVIKAIGRAGRGLDK